MEKRSVSIDLTTTEVKELLVRHLDIKQSERVADVIVGHLVQTDKGLGQLFKALIGVFPTAQYKPGDMLWVHDEVVPFWKFDKDATKALPNFRDGVVLVQVKTVNVYSGNPYTVSLTAVKTGAKTPIEDTMLVSEHNIVEKAEDFTDILEALEKMIDDADLPF